MDPTSIASRLDQSVKAVLILSVGITVCVGFFVGLLDDSTFMPFAYMVAGAAFGRTMGSGMSAFTKTTETAPDGSKKETTQSTPPSVPAVPPPTVTEPGTVTTTTTATAPKEKP